MLELYPLRSLRSFYLTLLYLTLLFLAANPFILPLTAGSSESVVEIDDIIVTASPTDSDLFHREKSTTLIDREAIEASAAITVDELLRSVVGTDVWKPHGEFGPASSIRLRGFADARATVILKDGMPINSMDCGQALYNEIPLDTVERVEIIHGSTGAVQGKSAMAGVINIVTQKGAKKFDAHASAGYGSYNTFTAEAGVGGTISNNIKFRVGYNHFNSDGYFTWNDAWIRDRVEAMDQVLLSWNNPAEGWSVKENYLAALEKMTRTMNTINLTMTGKVADLFEFNVTGAWWENNSDIGYKFGSLDQERKRLGLNLTRRGKTYKVRGNFYYLNQDVLFSQPVLPSPDMDGAKGQQCWLVQGHKSDVPLIDYGGSFTLDLTTGENNTVSMSTDHRHGSLKNRLYDGFTDDTISINQADQYIWGVSVEDRITFGKLTANLGVRYSQVKTSDFFYENQFSYVPYEYSSLEDDRIDPWLGLIFKMEDTTKIRAGISRSSTFAPLSYLLGDYQRPPGRTIIGNPQLRTEYAYNYEIGVEKLFGDSLFVNLTFYYNDIRDWMQQVSAASPEFSSISVRWENIDQAETKGLELETEYLFSEQLQFFANYTLNFSDIIQFTDTEFNYNNKQLEGNTFPNQPKHKVNMGFNWKHPRWFNLTFNLRYSGDRYYDIENTVVLDDYITCDIKVMKKINKTLAFSLEAKDLFDQEWAESEMHHTPGRTVLAKIMLTY